MDFYITWVYGDPDFSRRVRNWETLRDVGINRSEPWICVGDFDDIVHHKENWGKEKGSM